MPHFPISPSVTVIMNSIFPLYIPSYSCIFYPHLLFIKDQLLVRELSLQWSKQHKFSFPWSTQVFNEHFSPTCYTSCLSYRTQHDFILSFPSVTIRRLISFMVSFRLFFLPAADMPVVFFVVSADQSRGLF